VHIGEGLKKGNGDVSLYTGGENTRWGEDKQRCKAARGGFTRGKGRRRYFLMCKKMSVSTKILFREKRAKSELFQLDNLLSDYGSATG